MLGEFDRRSGMEGCGGIVCCQQIVLGEFERGWEWKGVGELCVDSRSC